jgi:hypothetical protein
VVTLGPTAQATLVYIKKYFKAKELWKLKYFPMQKYIIFKKCSKRNQNPSRYYNSIITNLKFQNKPKYHLSKILLKKQTYYYYLGAKIP